MTEEQKNDAAPQSAQGDLHRENEAQERKGLKVPRTVWALGFVSLLMDISSEMIHALLPLFMAGPLGASAVLIGLVEGAGEGAALITKVFSGAAADRFGHRGPEMGRPQVSGGCRRRQRDIAAGQHIFAVIHDPRLTGQIVAQKAILLAPDPDRHQARPTE